jgi:hypothetical protein
MRDDETRYFADTFDGDGLNRARAIGLELAETDAQTEALNASLARDERRRQIASDLARESYHSDDVEVSRIGDNRGEVDVESVDGGYWVSARVWVYAEDVEAQLEEEASDA